MIKRICEDSQHYEICEKEALKTILSCGAHSQQVKIIKECPESNGLLIKNANLLGVINSGILDSGEYHLFVKVT